MLLGEALDEIGKLRSEIPSLSDRARAGARYQDGEEPAEDTMTVLAALEQALARQEQLSIAVHLTNATREVTPGLTITAAIARRRRLIALAGQYDSTADAAAGGRHHMFDLRRTRSELKQITTVPVADVRAKAKDAAKEAAQLNALLQQANWSTDLVEAP